jgi:hypothetical protein
MSASGRNKGRQIHSYQKAQRRAEISNNEVQTSVRESRHGYRGTAMFQTTRYYSQEGLLVVNLGGPPIVGR